MLSSRACLLQNTLKRSFPPFKARPIKRKPKPMLKKFGSTSYDLHVQADGLVHPIDGAMFEKPNGCSLRPDGPTMQEIIRNFGARDTVVWRIEEGTHLPPTLILYHEHSDHYSLQPRVPMPLSDLDAQLTAFFHEHGEWFTQDEWCEAYPF
ncbi:hypothetical protein JCM6882_004795 [Rhodosporidiobolus microsporus]